MQILDTFLTFLAEYREAINTGVIIGFIAAIFASAIAALIFLARWRNLLKIRSLNHQEEIEAVHYLRAQEI